MTLLRLTPATLARSRFAISPLAETLGALICLQRPHPEPWIATWHARHQAGYRQWLEGNRVAAGLLPLVAATKQFPDIVGIPPRQGPRTRLASELAAVADHTDQHVRATVAESIAASWQPQDASWLDVDGLALRVADTLHQGWQHFVAPDWSRRRSILERDIMYRAGLLAVHGWKHAIETIRDRPVWVTDTAIRFSDRSDADRLIPDDGLILVPRTTPGGWWTCEQPPGYALVYPCRGQAAPAPDSTTDKDRLATLLGTGRARIVRNLVRPATSTQLAHALDLSLGTVSAHLAVLRDAEIAAGTRVGRTVVYQLTERGTQLLALN